MIKIHVDTSALAERRTAILVVPEPPDATEVARYVAVLCPCCGARSATVEQHENTAHVMVTKRENLLIGEHNK